MQDLMKLTCGEFVSELASSSPAPGGGGAASFVGAIGVALGNMVGSLTLGKEKYADVQDEVLEIKSRACALQNRLLDLVGADARAFEPLSRAYGLPKETAEEQAHKAQVMEACLRDACAVPLQIMQACCDGIDLIERIAAIGSRLAISDAGCGAACCMAALRAASLNVFINTKSMADRSYARECEEQALGLLDEYCPKADAVYQRVMEMIS